MTRRLLLRAGLHGVSALVLTPMVALMGASVLGLFADEACAPGQACGSLVLAVVAGLIGFAIAFGVTLIWGLTSDWER